MKKITICSVSLICVVGAFAPNFASADTVFVSGSITSDTTWVSSNVYVINSSFSVASGVTLTIEPGTVIKGRSTGLGGPSIYGNLVALGKEENPIIFTSSNDDSLFGSIDEYESVGAPGDWQGLYFNPGSTGHFDHVQLSYAGYGGSGYGNFVGIENDGGNLEIKNSKIFDNHRIVSNGAGGVMTAGSGIWNKSGDLSIQNSLIENSMVGVRVDSGNISISETTFKNNIDSTGQGHGYGIYTSGSDSLTLLNNVFEGNKRTAHIRIAPNFVHSGNVSSDETNRGFEIDGDLSGEVVLSSGDIPYIVGHLVINSSGKLIVDPGVILKMNDFVASGAIYVNGGTLEFRGTPENKIYITSLRDDTIGGDTNGDGDLTLPALRNWASIFLESGSTAVFENVELGYGGYNWNGEYLNIGAAVYQRGADLSIKNSVFHHNRTADIFTDGGNTQILDTEFNGSDYGIWSRGGSTTVSNSSFTNHVGLGVYGESGPQVDARNNWWGSSDGPKDTSNPNPTGSGDKIQGNVNYTPFLTSWPPSTEKVINPVIIVPGIMGSDYAPLSNKLVLDPILHTYDNLIATLEANGYVENDSLFTFPYEWRDSNVITANILKDKIAAVIQECTAAAPENVDCSKVDLVAHSMGGLVAREHIQSGQYQDNVDQLIFLGTPHKGSPEAYLTWEAGEFSSDGILNRLLKLKFTVEALHNFYPSLFDYIQERPISSIKELLPIFDYLKESDTGILRVYPNNYPRNIFLEALNLNIPNLFIAGVEITNFIGNAADSTVEKVGVVESHDSKKWAHGQPTTLEYGLGDMTVPVAGSSLDVSINNKELNSTHTKLPTVAAGDIVKILTGKDSVQNVDNGIIRNMLVIHLYSPIDMVITAPDGKKMGKYFETGEIYNEIPLAFYSGYQTENEFITIPNPIDGEYKVEIMGVDGGGKYGVSTSFISDEVLVTKDVVGIAAQDQITNLSVDFGVEDPENISTEKIVTPEILLKDIELSYNLGWIKDKKIRDSLIKQVNAAIKFSKKIEKVKERLPDGSVKEKKVEKFSVKVNKILVNLFTRELEVLFNKYRITQEAYDLIMYDVEYLKNN